MKCMCSSVLLALGARRSRRWHRRLSAQGSIAGQLGADARDPARRNEGHHDRSGQDGDKVSGELTSPMGSVPVTGTFSGGNLLVRADIDMQGVAITMGFDGTLAGDAMNGTVKLGDFGEFSVHGQARRRVKPLPRRQRRPHPPMRRRPRPERQVRCDRQVGRRADASRAWVSFPCPRRSSRTDSKVTGTLTSLAGEVAVNGTMTGTSLKLEFRSDDAARSDARHDDRRAGPRRVHGQGQHRGHGRSGLESDARELIAVAPCGSGAARRNPLYM